MKTIKTFEEFLINTNNKSKLAITEKIKYQKGKSYQSGEGWTVFKSGDNFMFDINVNNSAGWSTDPNDDKNETLILMDAGKKRAFLTFKSGNIDKFAQQMHDLNTKTTWGETVGLSAKDYADIIRVWIDMKIHSRIKE